MLVFFNFDIFDLVHEVADFSGPDEIAWRTIDPGNVFHVSGPFVDVVFLQALGDLLDAIRPGLEKDPTPAPTVGVVAALNIVTGEGGFDTGDGRQEAIVELVFVGRGDESRGLRLQN